MNRDFKFPATRSTAPPPGLDESKLAQPASAKAVITPSSIEVPPPPPIEKERTQSSMDEGEDEVGDTVDIPLN